MNPPSALLRGRTCEDTLGQAWHYLVTMGAHVNPWGAMLYQLGPTIGVHEPVKAVCRLHQAICTDVDKTLGPLCGVLFNTIRFEVDLPSQ